jgi:carotenoid cleavage dioxygenase-like enzyme
MDVEVVARFLSTLPEDDDHPYRTGPWRPQTTEWDADDLTVVAGEIPAIWTGCTCAQHREPAASGVEVLPPVRRRRHDPRRRLPGRKSVLPQQVHPDRRLAAETAAGGPLWPGLAGPAQLARGDQGWGARGLMKDASSTDVIVHRGVALTSFYQCGDLYEDGDEIVLDGFFEDDPEPADLGSTDKWQRAFRFLALDRIQARLHRWRFNLVTGATSEERLTDSISEFGMINAGFATTATPTPPPASRGGSCSTA